MIELRRRIEFAVTHPVWGPIVIVVLVVLLAAIFIHVVADDTGFVADVGVICFGVASALAAILCRRFPLEAPLLLVGFVQERGPPRFARCVSPAIAVQRTADFVLPLRR